MKLVFIIFSIFFTTIDLGAQTIALKSVQVSNIGVPVFISPMLKHLETYPANDHSAEKIISYLLQCFATTGLCLCLNLTIIIVSSDF